MRTRHVLELLAVVPTLLFVAPASSAEFALRDGDVVAFLGDSITAEGTYARIIEEFTLLRYPERSIRFYNAGVGGDTAADGLARLEQDIFDNEVTVVTVAFGINDIGWGFKADEEHRSRYLEAVQRITTLCVNRNIRVFVCSAAVTAESPDTSADGFLQRMCDEGLQLASDHGAETIDVQRTMRSIQRRIAMRNAAEPDVEKHASLHVQDGVHLSELGQLAMAFAMLRGLGAEALVSSVSLDAATESVSNTEHCEVEMLPSRPDVLLRFTRRDDRLPFNHGLFFALHYRFVPMLTELNDYRLVIRHLESGKYKLAADGRALGSFSAAQLDQGVNLAAATADVWQHGGPWDVQAAAISHPWSSWISSLC